MRRYVNISNSEIAQALLDIGVIKKDSQTNQLFVSEVKISQLPAAAPVQDTDLIAQVQSGVTVKQTDSATSTYVSNQIMMAGNRYLSTDNYATDNLASAPNFNLQGVYNGNNVVLLADSRPFYLHDPVGNNGLTVDIGSATVSTDYNLTSPNLNALQTETDNFIAGIDNTIFNSLQSLSAGLTITQNGITGVSEFTLTGTGADAAYGYASSSLLTTPFLAFSDTTTWIPIPAASFTDSAGVNLIAGVDSYGFFLQSLDATTSIFVINFQGTMARGSSTTPNWYYINPMVSNDGVSAPVIYNSAKNQLGFALNAQAGSGDQIITYTFPVSLPQNGKVYIGLQNRNALSGVDNNIMIKPANFMAQKIGDVGGLSSGVVSINSLQGLVTLTSSNGSLVITTTPGNINLSATPPLSGYYFTDPIIVSGATSAMTFIGRYKANSAISPTDVELILDLIVESDNSHNLIILDIPIPFGNNFNDGTQSRKIGFDIVPSAIVDNPAGGAISCGWFNDLFANSGTQNVRLYFETSAINTIYRVSLALNYAVQ